MGDVARLNGVAVRPCPKCPREVDDEIGASSRGHAHITRSVEQRLPACYSTRQAWIVNHSLEHLRVFVRNHQDPSASAEHGFQLRRVEQTFDRTVDDEAGRLKCGNRRGVAGDCDRCSSGSDRHLPVVGRSRHHHLSDPATEPSERQPCRFNQIGSARCLREQNHRLACL